MKSIIILLAIALVVGADIDKIIEQEEALSQFLEQLAPKKNTPEAGKYKHLMQEVRKARATKSIIGWVDAGSNGCQNLSSHLSSYCGITYQSPGIIVSRIGPIIEPLIDPLNNYNLTTASCKGSIKEILCKGFFPQCSSDASTATYQNFNSACNNIVSCNNSVINIDGVNSGTLCSNSGQTINLKSCVKFTSNIPGVNQSPCGPLPANITFPVLSLRDLARNRFLVSSLNIILSPSSGVTSQCYNQWQKFLCTNAPYCSPDQTKVLSAVTKQQCESAINCLPPVFKTNFAAVYKCSSYPDEGSLTMCLDPSQGFAQVETNTTVACGEAPTTAAFTTTVASPMAPNTTTISRASALSIGSTLFYLVCMLLAYFY